MSGRKDPLSALVHKEVPFRFAGRNLFFDLSQALFSSFDIDTGSRLLLKSLLPLFEGTFARKPSPEKPLTLLDTGCGTGVLGLSLAAAAEAQNLPCRIHLQDRDALAVAFSRRNAAKNNLAGDPRSTLTISHALALQNLPADVPSWDLILSNWPAKAGQPVLERFLTDARSLVPSGGRLAMVIVKTLAEALASSAAEAGWKTLGTERHADHTVFHFTPQEASAPAPAPAPKGKPDFLEPYIRQTGMFRWKEHPYKMATVYNVPNFDTRSHQMDLALDALIQGKIFSPKTPFPGPALHWQPGQGHLPILVGGSPLILAGRDALQLAVSRRNILAQGQAEPFIIEAPALPLLTERLEKLRNESPALGFLSMELHNHDPSATPAQALTCAKEILPSGGCLLVYGKAGLLASLAAKHPGFSKRADKKRRGVRALVLEKK